MYQLDAFAPLGLSDALLGVLIDEHEAIRRPRFERLWNYYRNTLAEPDARGGSSGYPAQAAGLPPRLSNLIQFSRDSSPREIVIENDIGWRIQVLNDFMFPAPPRILSKAPDPARRPIIEQILHTVIEANGGIQLWQDAALLGSVYGHVDFFVNTHALSSPRAASTRRDAPGEAASKHLDNSPARRAGNAVLIETVEAPRAIALLDPADYRRVIAYIIHYTRPSLEVSRGGWLAELTRRLALRPVAGFGARRAETTVTEIHSATHSQRYENNQLIWERRNPLGLVPVTHVQNMSQPLHYEGLSDVEPLIPLQDELNTRLSDRANRVTFQSFRMWLGKGIEGFVDRPIGPGQMWMTDNLNASIESFGGDADSPSETAHIEQIREALDKASGVTPAAAGHIRARVGNLTSENALRISLMGTLAKVKRKRVTYAAGIAELCRLILHALHVQGIVLTTEADRAVEVAWTDPLPIDESRRITDALAKAKLGIPLERLRTELGYANV